MIAYLKGIIASKDAYGIIMEVNGIGYELSMSSNAIAKLPSTGNPAQVFTYMQIKDDGISLVGFVSLAEKEMFTKLISVSGIGPKMAISALSAMSPAELAASIAEGDVKYISTIPGVGKKTAQRIVLELQGVLKTEDIAQGAEGAVAGTKGMSDAAEALEGMGFSTDEVASALKGCTESEVSAIVRYGLKNMGGR